MDLSYYLSEILEQQGEVNVSGLGHFAKVRVNGYYNDDEARFYPPYNEIQFDPLATAGDDTFLKYISEKKAISIASSRFFMEQFISHLIQESAVKDVEVSGLGWLRNDKSRLVFRSKTTATNDPAFYGLPALQIHKIGSEPVTVDQPIPELSLTIAAEPEYVQAAAEAEDTFAQEEYFEEEYEEKRGLNVKLIALILGGVLIVAAAALYWYKPSIFGVTEKRKPLVATTQQQPVTIDTTAKNTVPVKRDTVVNKTPVAKDTVAKTTVPKATVPQAITTQKPATTTTASKNTPATQTSVKQPVTVTPAPAQNNISLDAPVKKTIIDQEARAARAESTDQLPWIPTYAIIGGTFPKREQAEDAVDEFIARGVPAQVIQDKKSKKMFVVIGTFQTNAEAYAALREMKRVKKARKDNYIKELK